MLAHNTCSHTGERRKFLTYATPVTVDGNRKVGTVHKAPFDTELEETRAVRHMRKNNQDAGWLSVECVDCNCVVSGRMQNL